ncbi:MAG: ATP-binding protein [Cytophagaceae bacterium]|jgi:two-component system phosphate regulon sensor histidine kinase PhoR|nr:ATP-binding protein [Cytophagaceae bacterium]
MFFNARNLSILLSIVCTAALLLVLRISGHGEQAVWVGLFAWLLILGISWLMLDRFVFREIGHLNELLEKFKNKDFRLQRVPHDPTKPYTVLEKMRDELLDFANQKQKEIDELKKLETFRREFLADVSHELKTPIFAAQGFIHTLIDGAVDDIAVRDRFLQKAASSMDGLNILVQDLITISQLEIGEIKMHFQSFDLHKLTEDIFDQLEDTAARKGSVLKFYEYSPKSCYVYADKLRIGQVMTNLIINAVKYGKDEGVTEVRFTIDQDEVEVLVIDDGPGIEQKHLSRIFERFYRVEKSRARDKGGTGLGLAIVKHIVEAHQSKVQVQSEPGVGTAFSFRLKRGKVIKDESLKGQ